MTVDKTSESFQSFSNNARASGRIVEKNLQLQLSKLRNLTFVGVQEIVKDIYDESQLQVPVSPDGSHGKPPGTLKKSGYFQVEKTGIDKISGVVGYDRNDEAPYAVYVHERLDQRHVAPTKAKFLEDPVKIVARNIQNILARKLKLR